MLSIHGVEIQPYMTVRANRMAQADAAVDRRSSKKVAGRSGGNLLPILKAAPSGMGWHMC